MQALLQPSLLLVWGGSNLQPAYPEASIFNATALTWESTAPLLQARSWSGSAASSAGAFAAGGMSLVPFLVPWTRLKCTFPPHFSSISLLTGSKLFPIVCCRYYPESNTWAYTPSLPSPPRVLELRQNARAQCKLPPVSKCPTFNSIYFRIFCWRRPKRQRCLLIVAAVKRLATSGWAQLLS